MHFWIIFIIVIALDQITKLLVQTFMSVSDSFALIEGLLSFTYILNPGAAFGLFAYQTTVFIVITVIVIFLIILVNYKLPDYFVMMRTGLAFQLGGAVGNLVDRVRIGYVIDFFDISFFPPIFNIADIAIVIGIFYFAISLFGEGRQPFAAKKYLPSEYKKVNLRFSPFGYDYKEVEDYLMILAGDIELLNLGRQKIEDQLYIMRKELKKTRNNHFERKDKLRKAVDNLQELKEKVNNEIEELKKAEEEKKKEYSEKIENLREENKDLALEEEELLLNRKKYEGAVRITDKVLSAIYRLSETIPENARKESAKICESIDKSRQEVLDTKNLAEKEYQEIAEENKRLQQTLMEKKNLLEKNYRRKESMEKALSKSEEVAEKIREEAILEAETIKKAAEQEASELIEEAEKISLQINDEDVESYPQLKDMLEKEKELFKEEITQMLKNFEEDSFIKDS